MALPNTGPIAMSDVVEEFFLPVPTSMSQWYGLAEGVPVSGEMKMSDMLGKSSVIVKTVTNDISNLLISDFFTFAEWTSTTPKEIVIETGITVGGTSPAIAAIRTGTGRSGLLKITNRGTIIAAGGVANSGTGGTAIDVQQAGVTVDNSGSIISGGGGGGAGGAGGAGGPGTYIVNTREPASGDMYVRGSFDVSRGNASGWVWVWNNVRVSSSSATAVTVGNITYYRGGFQYALSNNLEVYGINRVVSTTFSSTGGAGGSGTAGGRGAGYLQTSVTPGAGTAGVAGGTNAGTGGLGGTGGKGGELGQPGANGTAGGNGTSGNAGAGAVGGAGSSGGAAGNAIGGVARILNNTGTIIGPIA